MIIDDFQTVSFFIEPILVFIDGMPSTRLVRFKSWSHEMALNQIRAFIDAAIDAQL